MGAGLCGGAAHVGRRASLGELGHWWIPCQTRMGKAMKIIILIVGALLAWPALATPGGVDARGCHESTKIGLHCHPGRASPGASSESKTERERRLRRECKGQRNGGMCSGYGTRS